MPRLLAETSLGYRIENDDGSQYDVPRDIAKNSYPELFPQPGTEYVPDGSQVWNPFQISPTGQAEVPPWLQQQHQQFQPPQPSVPHRAEQQPSGQQAAQVVPDQAMTPQEAQSMQLRPGQSVSVPVSRTGLGFMTINPEIIPTPEESMQQLTPGYMAQSAGLERQKAAAYAQGQVGYNPEFGPTYDQVGAQEQQMAADLEAQNAQAQQALAAKEAEIAQARMQISKMDPGRLFKNASVPTQALSVISAGVAGFLNPGGQNQVIETVMRLIDQDMEAQRTDIESQKFNVQGMESAYGRMATRQASDRANLLFDRSLKIEALINGIEREKGRYQSDVVLGQLEMAQGQLAVEAAKSYQEAQKQFVQDWRNYAKDVSDIAAQKLQYRAQRASIAESRASRKQDKPPEEQKVIRLADPNDPKAGIDIYVDPKIWGDMSATEKDAWRKDVGQHEKKMRAVDRFYRAVQKAQRLYGGPGKDWYDRAMGDSEMRKELIAGRSTAIEALGRQEAGMNYTESEMQLRKDMIGDFDTWMRDGGAETLLPAVREEQHARRAERLFQVGGYYKQDAILPVATPTGPVAVNHGTMRIPFEPGNARQWSEKSSPPIPTGVEENTPVVGWRHYVPQIEDDVRVVQSAKGADKVAAVESLHIRLNEFARVLDDGEVPLDQNHRKELDRIEAALEQLPPAQRQIQRNLLTQFGGDAVRENYPSFDTSGLDYTIDALDFIKSTRAVLDKQLREQELEHERAKRIERRGGTGVQRR